MKPRRRLSAGERGPRTRTQMSVALKIFGSFTLNRRDRAVQGEIQHRLEPQDRLRHVLSCVEAAAAFVRGRTRAANANADVRRAENFRKFHFESPRSRCAGRDSASPRATRPSETCAELCGSRGGVCARENAGRDSTRTQTPVALKNFGSFTLNRRDRDVRVAAK